MSDQIDPLAIPAGDLKEPTFPVLKEGLYRLEVRAFDLVEGDKPDAKRISIKLALTADGKFQDGGPAHKGFAFSVPIFITPGENRTATQVAEQVAMPIKAALGPKTRVMAKDCLQDKSLIVGKVLDAQVGIREGKGEYKDTFSNNIKKWIIPN